MANLFSDGFESGDLTAWDVTSIDGGDLSAEIAAKLHGNYGLNVFIDDTNHMYVQDNTPSAETRYRCRFYIDPNELTMANNDNFRIIWANTGAPYAFFMPLKYVTGTGYITYVKDYTDGTWAKFTASYTLSDAPHCIEVDWKASSGAGNNDGEIKLWIDGVLKETLSNIDNDTETINAIQFGATANIDAGTSGTFYLDDFASNNDGSEIGRISEGNFFMFLSTMWEKHKEIWKPNKKILIPDLI